MAYDGLTSRRIFESIVNTVASDTRFVNLILGKNSQRLTFEELKEKCFDIKLDMILTKERISSFPLIQVYKYSSDPHKMNRFLRNIFIAVQTNSKDGETSVILGELIEDILVGNFLTLEPYCLTVAPNEFIVGKQIPSNVMGVYAYNSIFRFIVNKKSK
jgi:hypothetical protein